MGHWITFGVVTAKENKDTCPSHVHQSYNNSTPFTAILNSSFTTKSFYQDDMKMVNKVPDVKVAVIGAGWSGIYALKYLIEEELDVICFEKRENIGGVWRLAEEKETTASSSKTYLHPSDFPFDENTYDFPSARQINDHIEKYAEKFNLLDRIQFGTEVLSLRYINSKWEILLRKEQRIFEIRAENIVIAVGTANKPYIPDDLARKFSGIPVTHNQDITMKQLSTLSDDECVLVVGGGESATDMAAKICEKSRVKVVLSLRTGRWFLFKKKPPENNFPADVVSRKTLFLFSLSWFVKWFDWYVISEMGVGSHGVPAWAPNKETSSWGCFINKRGEEAISGVRRGRILPAGKITKISTDNIVTFENVEHPLRISRVIFATGYRFDTTLLSPVNIQPPSSAYQYTFPTTDGYGSIAFVGAARPNMGSVPSLAEITAIWISRVFSGRTTLPSVDTAVQKCADQTAKRLKNFGSDGEKLTTLVYEVDYVDSIMKELGMIYLVRLLPPINVIWMYGLRGVWVWWTLFLSGWSPLEYRVLLNKDGKGLEALEEIRKMNRVRKIRSPGSLLSHMIRFTVRRIREFVFSCFTIT